VFKGVVDELVQYVDIDQDILKSLGIPVKDKSVCVGDAFVFCEEYTAPDDRDVSKHLWHAASLLRTLWTANIVQAKEIVNSYSEIMINNPYFSEVLSVIVSIYGFEYSEYEFELPYKFGGWFTPQLDGWDLSMEVPHSISTRTLVKLYRMAQTSIKLFGKSVDRVCKKLKNIKGEKEDFYSPFGTLVGAYPEWFPEAPFLLGKTDTMYNYLVSQYVKRELTEMYYEVLLKERDIRRKKFVEPGYSQEKLFNKVIKDHPATHFCIPTDYITEWYSGETMRLKGHKYVAPFSVEGLTSRTRQKLGLFKLIYPDVLVSELIKEEDGYGAMEALYPFNLPRDCLTVPPGTKINGLGPYLETFIDPVIPFTFYNKWYGAIPKATSLRIKPLIKPDIFWRWGDKDVRYFVQPEGYRLPSSDLIPHLKYFLSSIPDGLEMSIDETFDELVFVYRHVKDPPDEESGGPELDQELKDLRDFYTWFKNSLMDSKLMPRFTIGHTNFGYGEPIKDSIPEPVIIEENRNRTNNPLHLAGLSRIDRRYLGEDINSVEDLWNLNEGDYILVDENEYALTEENAERLRLEEIATANREEEARQARERQRLIDTYVNVEANSEEEDDFIAVDVGEEGGFFWDNE